MLSAIFCFVNFDRERQTESGPDEVLTDSLPPELETGMASCGCWTADEPPTHDGVSGSPIRSLPVSGHMTWTSFVLEPCLFDEGSASRGCDAKVELLLDFGNRHSRTAR